METTIQKFPDIQVLDIVEIYIDMHCLSFIWTLAILLIYLFIYMSLFGVNEMGMP